MLRRSFLQMLACAAATPAMAADWPVELAQPAALSPLAQSGLFNAIARAGPRLVAVGERGRILLSDDAGLSWRQVPCPVSVTLISCQFVSPQLGWIAGQMGVVLKSTDGGANWVRVLDGVTAANAMLAEAKADTATSAPSDALTAEVQNAQFFVTSGPSTPLLTLVPVSATHLLAFGGFGLALESLDGGETWRGIAARVPDPNGFHIYATLRSGDAVIAVGEQGLILRGPADGALCTIASPFAGSLFGILALGAGHHLAFGLQGAVLLSADDGLTWRSGTPATSSGILAGVVLNDGRILLGDEGGNLLLSGDGGESFTLIPGTAPVTALAQAPDLSIMLGTPIGLHRMPHEQV